MPLFRSAAVPLVWKLLHLHTPNIELFGLCNVYFLYQKVNKYLNTLYCKVRRQSHFICALLRNKSSVLKCTTSKSSPRTSNYVERVESFTTHSYPHLWVRGEQFISSPHDQSLDFQETLHHRRIKALKPNVYLLYVPPALKISNCNILPRWINWFLIILSVNSDYFLK
jgi:hypothetical protein